MSVPVLLSCERQAGVFLRTCLLLVCAFLLECFLQSVAASVIFGVTVAVFLLMLCKHHSIGAFNRLQLYWGKPGGRWWCSNKRAQHYAVPSKANTDQQTTIHILYTQ